MRWLVLLCLVACGLPPETGAACTDDADNDRDGLFDCDDPDCGDSLACADRPTGDTGSR